MGKCYLGGRARKASSRGGGRSTHLRLAGVEAPGTAVGHFNLGGEQWSRGTASAKLGGRQNDLENSSPQEKKGETHSRDPGELRIQRLH